MSSEADAMLSEPAHLAGTVNSPEKPNIEGNDRVVREFDVYLSRCEPADMQVYVLQYPLRPPDNPYRLEEQCEGVRVKPNQCKLEVEIGLDAHGPNYDRNAQPQMHIGKQTLNSMPVPARASYAVGLMKNGALHLVPVHVAVQLRPCLQYLDAHDEKKRAEGEKAKKKSGEEMGDEDDDARNAQLTPLQLQIKRRETERQAEMRLHSHAYLKQREEEEKWVELEAYGADSETAALLRDQLSRPRAEALPFTMTRARYLSAIVPSDEQMEKVTPGFGSAAKLTKQYLESLPLDTRVQAIFSRGTNQTLTYRKVAEMCPSEASEEDVLRALEKWAVLVQGCWVASSALRSEGQPTRYKIRDALLLSFTERRVLTRVEVQALAGAGNMEVARSVLADLAVHHRREGTYEFKQETDFSFLSAHPELVERQRAQWESGTVRAQPSEADDVATTTAPSCPVSSLPPMVLESLKVALLTVMKTRRVCSLRGLRQWLVSDPEAGVAVQAADASDEEILSTARSCVLVIGNTLVLPETGDENIDPFRNILIDLLIRKKSVKKAEILAEASKVLGAEVPTSVYNKVMKDTCVTKGGEWLLKSGDEPDRK